MRLGKCCLILIVAICILSCEKASENILQELTLETSVLEMKVGQSAALKVVGGSPSDGRWKSSNSGVAVVDEKGKVSAVSEGVATVTVYSGSISASAVVYVSELKVDSITFNNDNIILKQGESIELQLSVSPDDTGLDILYEIERPNIASVENGKIVAVSEGFTYVRAVVGDVSDSCMVTVISEPEIGDYFYSDGSWLSSYENEKQLVGIVFWTGDPTISDPILRQEHPQCINGLVAAIYDEECSWQTNHIEYSSTIAEWLEENAPEYIPTCVGKGDVDVLNEKLGYNNTSAILQFNLDPENNAWKSDAVKRLLFFQVNQDNKVPETTSGWYMPSAKELSLLCSGEVSSSIWDIAGPDVDVKELVNERISAAQMGMPIQDKLYWSSTEFDKDNALSINFKTGTVPYNIKRYGNIIVRYILAF